MSKCLNLLQKVPRQTTMQLIFAMRFVTECISQTDSLCSEKMVLLHSKQNYGMCSFKLIIFILRKFSLPEVLHTKHRKNFI